MRKGYQGKDEQESLNSFLATSFNVELVYIILKGITKFSKEEKKLQSGQSSHKRKIIRRIDRSKFKLNQIRIKDPSVWDVAKTEDFHEKEGETA